MKKYKVTIHIEEQEEERLPNYIVPTSNFEGAFIMGIPCKVVSRKSYKAERKTSWGTEKVEEVIDVESLVTGIRYTIPVGWYKEYETLDEAERNAKVGANNVVLPGVQDIIGMDYYPKDNSYIRTFQDTKVDAHHNLIGKQCVVISAPFRDTAIVPFSEDKRQKDFILVTFGGQAYRVLFQEWCFYPSKVPYTDWSL